MIEAIDRNNISEVIPVLQEFNKESGLQVKGKHDVAVSGIKRLLDADIAEIFVARHDGKVVGAIGGLVFPDYLSTEFKAQELFWFIKKEHRSGMTAVRLLRAYESWAISRGATRIIMACLKKLQGERIGRVYERLGYQEVETNYEKILPCQQE